MVHPNQQWVLLLLSIGNILSKGCSALSSPPPPPSSSSSSSSSKTTNDPPLPSYLFPNSIPISPRDIATFRRQTGQTAPSRAAVSIPACCRCRHGYPQAFAMDPVPPSPGGGKNHDDQKRRINSGMVKLTCPELVRAVDRLEDEGMIGYYNERLVDVVVVEEEEDGDRDDAGAGAGGDDREYEFDVKSLRESIRESHEAHAVARNDILLRRPAAALADGDDDEDALSYVEKTLGPRASEAFLSAGVAGVSGRPPSDDDDEEGRTTEIDVKCLHAWLADYLFRGEDKSLLGAMVAHRLTTMSSSSGQEKEGDLTFRGGMEGTAGCHVLCDPDYSGVGGGGVGVGGIGSGVVVEPPPMPRNKQRLKGRKERERRRRRRREEEGDQD